jgi:hypothetical protein
MFIRPNASNLEMSLPSHPGPLTSATVDDINIDAILGRVRVRAGDIGEATTFWPSLLMTGDMWMAQADHFASNR